MNNLITANIIADSISDNNRRITTFILNVPQIVTKELLRHRMFSFSSSSMRAIPFYKILKDTKENMFVPIAFQSHHSGMQGTSYLTGKEAEYAKTQWVQSGLKACEEAENLYNLGVTKQICSRIIEPYNYAKILLTATEFENFFKLRCPQYHTPVSGEGFYFRSKKDCIANHSDPDNLEKLQGMSIVDWQSINTSQAEIHMQALAEAMWDAMNESVPKELQPGMWHLPWQSTLDLQQLLNLNFITDVDQTPEGNLLDLMIKASTARCARLSYMTFDGEVNHARDIELHDRLLASGHMSPFEHCARAMNELEYDALVKTKQGEMSYTWEHGWGNNFRGWIQYRYLIENKG